MWEVNGTTKGPLTLVSSENDPNSSFIIVLTSNLLTLETYVYFTLLFGQTKKVWNSNQVTAVRIFIECPFLGSELFTLFFAGRLLCEFCME